MVVCFNKYLPEDGLSNWVVLGVELVKAMERVSILSQQEEESESAAVVSRSIPY